MNKMKWIMPLVFVAVVAAFSLVVMLLWNWLMPDVFGLTAISYWQALGLYVLCKLLFGFRMKPVIGGGYEGAIEEYSNPVRKKWASMSEEERKAFIERRREGYAQTPTNSDGE